MPRKVIIVDDNPDVRYLARMTVESDRCRVVAEGSNGVEALELVEEVRPDAVVLDLRMPVMDGLEATRILRYRFPDLQIIVLSGSDDPEVLRALEEAGADAAIDKDRITELPRELDLRDG